MSYDGAADTGRGVLQRNGRAGARARRRRTAERTTGLAVAVLAALTIGFAALWFAVSLPALAWLFAASVVGFGALGFICVANAREKFCNKLQWVEGGACGAPSQDMLMSLLACISGGQTSS